MLEVVFGRSAEGCLQYAQHCGEDGFSVLCPMEPVGTSAGEACAEQTEKQSTISLGGDKEDIFCFDTDYSVGDISGDGLSQARTDSLKALFSPFPESCARREAAVQESAEQLELLIDRASKGEKIRIWYSEQPYDYCGLCWLLSQLNSRMKGHMPTLSGIRLPNVIEQGGVLQQCMGWGGVMPEEVHRFLPLEQPITQAGIVAAMIKWQELQRQNTPLRAVINGELQSVPENFYDSFLDAVLARMRGSFREAELIGAILSQCKLGIGDEWFALRIEHKIAEGKLVQVMAALPGESSYNRMLQKVQ